MRRERERETPVQHSGLSSMPKRQPKRHKQLPRFTVKSHFPTETSVYKKKKKLYVLRVIHLRRMLHHSNAMEKSRD